MATKEQLTVLKQGVEVWNQWREYNPDVEIDLMGASLAGADLMGANLAGADLAEADLAGADLRVAHLKIANLMGAKLKGSNLRGAVLRESYLVEAYLVGANLAGADLAEADLTRSLIGQTIFGNNDLSTSVGLETIEHVMRSTIGIDTLERSEGKIPVAFLRGCGLNDLDIEYAKLADPDLTEKEIIDITYKISELRTGGYSIRYNSLFISYSTKDKEFAQRLYDDLQNSGVRCWFAPHDIQGGRKIHEQIDRAIQTHDRLLLILSDSSMNSEWVKTEIANARQKEVNEKRQVLFPLSIVDFQKIREWKNFDADTGRDSAREIREYYIPDFSNWKDKAAYQPFFERLLRDLKAQ